MTRDGRSAQAAAARTGLDQEGVMSSLLVRVGAVSAALAGVLIIGQEAWGLVVGRITEGRVESAVHTAQLLLLVFGIVGLYLAQQRAARVFGQVATLVALLGTITLFGATLIEVTILPELTESGSPLAVEPPPVLGMAMGVSFVLYILGLLLFGIATWRAGVLPWRAGALLVVGIVLGVALNGVVPGVLAVYGVALVWLGVAALQRSDQPAARPVETAGLAAG
jgi:hypothetical protein